MIKMLFLLLLLFGAVWLGVVLQHTPGYVLITVQNWTIESTLWVAAFVILIIFFILHFTLLIYRKMATLPVTWHNWRRIKKLSKYSKYQPKYQPACIAAYGHALMTQNKTVQAERYIRHALQKNMHPLLLKAYCALTSHITRLPVIVSLLKNH